MQMTTQPFNFPPLPLVSRDLDISNSYCSFADSSMVNLGSVRAKGGTSLGLCRTQPFVGGVGYTANLSKGGKARPNEVLLKHKQKAGSDQRIYKKKVLTSYENICWTIHSISNKAGQSLSPKALTFTKILPNYKTFLFFCLKYSIQTLKLIFQFCKMNFYLNQDTTNISFYSQKKRFLNNLLNIQKLFLQFTFDLLPILQSNQKFQKEVFQDELDMSTIFPQKLKLNKVLAILSTLSKTLFANHQSGNLPFLICFLGFRIKASTLAKSLAKSMLTSRNKSSVRKGKAQIITKRLRILACVLSPLRELGSASNPPTTALRTLPSARDLRGVRAALQGCAQSDTLNRTKSKLGHNRVRKRNQLVAESVTGEKKEKQFLFPMQLREMYLKRHTVGETGPSVCFIYGGGKQIEEKKNVCEKVHKTIFKIKQNLCLIEIMRFLFFFHFYSKKQKFFLFKVKNFLIYDLIFRNQVLFNLVQIFENIFKSGFDQNKLPFFDIVFNEKLSLFKIKILILNLTCYFIFFYNCFFGQKKTIFRKKHFFQHFFLSPALFLSYPLGAGSALVLKSGWAYKLTVTISKGLRGASVAKPPLWSSGRFTPFRELSREKHSKVVNSVQKQIFTYNCKIKIDLFWTKFYELTTFYKKFTNILLDQTLTLKKHLRLNDIVFNDVVYSNFFLRYLLLQKVLKVLLKSKNSIFHLKFSTFIQNFTKQSQIRNLNKFSSKKTSFVDAPLPVTASAKVRVTFPLCLKGLGLGWAYSNPFRSKDRALDWVGLGGASGALGWVGLGQRSFGPYGVPPLRSATLKLQQWDNAMQNKQTFMAPMNQFTPFFILSFKFFSKILEKKLENNILDSFFLKFVHHSQFFEKSKEKLKQIDIYFDSLFLFLYDLDSLFQYANFWNKVLIPFPFLFDFSPFPLTEETTVCLPPAAKGLSKSKSWVAAPLVQPLRNATRERTDNWVVEQKACKKSAKFYRVKQNRKIEIQEKMGMRGWNWKKEFINKKKRPLKILKSELFYCRPKLITSTLALRLNKVTYPNLLCFNLWQKYKNLKNHMNYDFQLFYLIKTTFVIPLNQNILFFCKNFVFLKNMYFFIYNWFEKCLIINRCNVIFIEKKPGSFIKSVIGGPDKFTPSSTELNFEGFLILFEYCQKNPNLCVDFKTNLTLIKNYCFFQKNVLFFIEFKKNQKKNVQMIILPSYKSLKIHLKTLKILTQKSNSKTQLQLVQKIASEIVQWCYCYENICDFKLFYYCDTVLLRFLWKWAIRLHPTKSKKWIQKKYF